MRTDGALLAWGSNADGQLGDGTTTDHNAPVRIGSATTWKSISAGFGHSVATRADGTAWSWGGNGNGAAR